MSVYNYQNESQKNAVKARPTSRIREIQNYRVSGSVAIAQVVNNYGVQTIQDLKEALKNYLNPSSDDSDSTTTTESTTTSTTSTTATPSAATATPAKKTADVEDAFDQLFNS